MVQTSQLPFSPVCLVLHACMLSHFNHVRLCDPMDHSPPGSSVHGILQIRILEWVAISFSSHKVWSEWSEWNVWSEVAQSCLTLCDPVDYSLPGSSVHGIFQARVLEWVAISFSLPCFRHTQTSIAILVSSLKQLEVTNVKRVGLQKSETASSMTTWKGHWSFITQPNSARGIVISEQMQK